jgi:hypothetical protein
VKAGAKLKLFLQECGVKQSIVAARIGMRYMTICDFCKAQGIAIAQAY